MANTPPTFLLMLWTAWMVQAVLSAIQVRKFARLFVRKRHDRFAAYRPPVSVIVPFKGLDPYLDEHLHGLFEQDYPDYELLLVVDSTADPVYQALLDELTKYPHRNAQVLVAGPASNNEGQKVHNQLHAIDHLIAQKNNPPSDDPVWVFADSDAVPGSQWLADLVGPLSQTDRTGVTTGYRWLIPTPRPDDAGVTVWSHLASIINSSVACAYGHDSFNHAWGGSMAVRAQTALRGGLRDRLVGALCDDYQFSRMSRDLGLRIYFIPGCVVATPAGFDLRGLINFAHRQYLLTRVYAPRLFLTSLVFTSLYVAGLVSAWGWLGISMAVGTQKAWVWPAGVLAIVFGANQIRSSYRKLVVRRALGPDALSGFRSTLRLDRWATPVWMTLHWLLVVRSAFGRKMRWRGITYRLLAPQRVEKLSNQPPTR